MKLIKTYKKNINKIGIVQLRIIWFALYNCTCYWAFSYNLIFPMYILINEIQIDSYANYILYKKFNLIPSLNVTSNNLHFLVVFV